MIKKFIYDTLSVALYLLSAFILILGIYSLNDSILGAVLIICAGIVITPIFNRFYKSKFYKDLKKSQCLGLFLVFLLLGCVFSAYAFQIDKTEKYQNEYASKKVELIQNLQNAKTSSAYHAAINNSAPYIDIADDGFKEIYNKALVDLEIARKFELVSRFKENEEQIYNDMNAFIDKKLYAEALKVSEPYSILVIEKLDKLRSEAAEGQKRFEEERALKELKEAENAAKIARLNDPQKIQYMAIIDTYLYDFGNAKIEDIKDAVSLDLTLFNIKSYANIYYEAEKYKFSDQEQKILEKYKTQLIEFQRKAFPRMRDVYGTVFRERAWEHDIEGRTFGDGYRTLEISGYHFVTNQNIKVMMESISPLAHSLRFKKVQFRWAKEADEYTFFKIDSPMDTEIIRN